MSAAAERARAGVGPSLIDAMTERLAGHYIGDAELYRLPGELERLSSAEPIARLENQLRDEGLADEVTSVRAATADIVLSACQAALAQPLADQRDVLSHLYAGEVAGA